MASENQYDVSLCNITAANIDPGWAGWVCSACNMCIGYGETHVCPSITYPSSTLTISPDPSIDEQILARLKQIEERLEKIERKVR